MILNEGGGGKLEAVTKPWDADTASPESAGKWDPGQAARAS